MKNYPRTYHICKACASLAAKNGCMKKSLSKKMVTLCMLTPPCHRQYLLQKRIILSQSLCSRLLWLLASKRGELPKVQTQISTKHFYPFLRFELRARQILHNCALLKVIMNYESHFHRRTHTSDWYSSLCRARSYIEIKSLMKLFICVLWKRQIDHRWKDKKCTREVFLKELLEKNMGTFDWMVRT